MHNLSTSTPEWLRHLHENSWEAEILISGGSIFAIFTASDSFIEFIQQLKADTSIAGLDLFTVEIMFAIKGLTIGFLLHLLLRALWISLICLNNSVTAKTDSEENTDAREVTPFNLKQNILNLDHASGLVFFASFAFVLVVVGYFIFNVAFFYLFAFILNINPVFITNALFFFFIIEMTQGFLRRNRIAGKLYKPAYTVFSWVSLACFYRPWFVILFRNSRKWKVLVLSFVFVTITAAYTNISLVRLFHWGSILDQREYPVTSAVGKGIRYDNMTQHGNSIHFATIPSPLISGSYLRVFVPSRKHHEDAITSAHGTNFADIVSVELNHTAVQGLHWIEWRHEITMQKGIVSFVPVHSMSGKGTITVKINDEGFADIPFWKD